MRNFFRYLVSLFEAALLIAIAYVKQDKSVLYSGEALVMAVLYIMILLSFVAWVYMWSSVRDKRTSINKTLQIILIIFIFLAPNLLSSFIFMVCSILMGLAIAIFDYVVLIKNQDTMSREYIERSPELVLLKLYIAAPLYAAVMIRETYFESRNMYLLLIGVFFVIIHKNWSTIASNSVFKNSLVTMVGFAIVAIVHALMLIYNVSGILPIVNISLVFVLMDSRIPGVNASCQK